MQDFTFYSPTEIVFGRRAEERTASLIKKYGGTRVFLLYGGASAVKSGLIPRLEESLRAQGLACESMGGVHPNPLVSFAEQARENAVRFGADFILGAGGGSVLDTAKAVAHGTVYPETPLWDIWSGKFTVEKSLPVGAVLTIAAAGSETSNSAVLTNEALGLKRGFGSDWNRPRFALMNPELTFTLPAFQIACGVVDIMMHTIDRYFSAPCQNELTDAIAEALLRVVIENGPKALENPADYGAQSELMWAGSLSHNGLTGLGAPKDFSTHQLGHELSAKFDVAHGASLSAVWGSWAGYCLPEHPERFARFARNVWGCTGQDDAAAAQRAVDCTVSFFASLGMPTCFSALGIGVQPEQTLRDLADSCVNHGARRIGCFQPLDGEDVYRIYRLANH